MPRSKYKTFIATVIISALVGLLGGWCFYYINNSFYSNGLINTNINNRYSNQTPVVFRNARNVTVEHDEKAVETAQAMQQILAGVYLRNESGKYSLKNYQAQAMIVTTDGWLVTNLDPAVADSKLEDYVVVDSQGRVYDVGDSFYDENRFLFIRLEDARDLPVIDFVGYRNVTPGMQVVAVNWYGPYWQTFVSQVDASRFGERKSDVLSRDIELQSQPETGAFVAANLGGRIIGLFDRAGRLKSMDYFEIAISDLLSGKEIDYAKLGVTYSSLVWQAGWDGQTGALIESVEPQSAAAEAGLKAGDIIVSFNYVEINKQNDLSDILAELEPGDEANMSYLRDGAKQDAAATLK